MENRTLYRFLIYVINTLMAGIIWHGSFFTCPHVCVCVCVEYYFSVNSVDGKTNHTYRQTYICQIVCHFITHTSLLCRLMLCWRWWWLFYLVRMEGNVPRSSHCLLVAVFYILYYGTVFVTCEQKSACSVSGGGWRDMRRHCTLTTRRRIKAVSLPDCCVCSNVRTIKKPFIPYVYQDVGKLNTCIHWNTYVCYMHVCMY